MGPQLYCHGKYESATFDCEADALCNWEIFASECKSDEDKTYLSSERSASRVRYFLSLHDLSLACSFLLIRSQMEQTKRYLKLDTHVPLLDLLKGAKVRS